MKPALDATLCMSSSESIVADTGVSGAVRGSWTAEAETVGEIERLAGLTAESVSFLVFDLPPL